MSVAKSVSESVTKSVTKFMSESMSESESVTEFESKSVTSVKSVDRVCNGRACGDVKCFLRAASISLGVSQPWR